MTPADVNLEPPSQRVMVDTSAPVIQVQAANTDGDFCLRCTVVDANPNASSLRAVCKTESGDIQLEMMPNQPGVFRVKGTELMRFPVVVSAKDMAGNVGTKEVNIRELVGSTLTQAPPPKTENSPPPAVGTETKFVANPPPPRADLPIPPRPEPPVPPRTDAPAPRVDLPPSRIDLPPRTELPPMTKYEAPIAPETVTKVGFPPAATPILAPANPPAIPIPGAPNEVPNKLPPAPVEGPRAHSGPHQLISTTHATVEYRIGQVGPSGVGKVEIYMTPDKGQTWHRLSEDVQKRSPATINLPGDGVFGIRIVVTNGNGFGGKAPARGDVPHCTIEVDTTSPFVQMRSTELLPSSGHVELRWNATDKNLGSEPVSLFYRTQPDGPWQVIARGLKNDGVHRWAFPRDAGGLFFFKIEVADQAGNTSHDVTRQPISIDMTVPSATVVGVTGNAAARP
jgi:hypothetical protein